jgi:tetratricopeptide (TPR) repeat protein
MHESMANSQASLDLHPTDLSGIARTTALFGQVMALHRLGRIAESALRAAELEPLARKAGYVYFEAVCGWMNAWASFGIAPDVSTFEERFQKHVEIARASRIPLVVGLALAQLSLAKFYRGERADALSIAHEANQTAIPPSTKGFATGILFRELAYAGDRDDAMALLDREQGGLPAVDQPSVLGSWAFLVSAIEGLAVLGERVRTAELFPLAERLLETGVVTFPMASRFPLTAAGIAATAARQWQSAEEHFRIALRQADEIPDHFERADIQRFYGSMLLERDSRGDHEQARRLLTDALAGYIRMAMPTYIELTEAMLSHI